MHCSARQGKAAQRKATQGNAHQRYAASFLIEGCPSLLGSNAVHCIALQGKARQGNAGQGTSKIRGQLSNRGLSESLRLECN